MNKGLLYLISKKPVFIFRDGKKHPAKFLGYLLLISYIILLPFVVKNFIENVSLNTKDGFVLILSIFLIYIYLPSYLNVINGKFMDFSKEEINFLFHAPIKPQEIIIYGTLKALLISIAFSISSFILAYFICNVSFTKSFLYSLISFVLAELFDTNLFIFISLTKYKNSMKGWAKYLVLGILLGILAFVFYTFSKIGFSLDAVKRVVLSDFMNFIPIIGFMISLLKLIILGPNAINIIFTTLYILSLIALIIYNKNICEYDIFFEDSINFSDKMKKIREHKYKNLKKDKNNKVIKGVGAKALTSKIFIEKSREKNGYLVYLLFIIISLLSSYFIFAKKNMELGEMIFISIFLSFYLNGFVFGNTKFISELKEDYYYLIPINPYKKIFFLSIYDIYIILLRAAALYIPLIFMSKIDIYLIAISFIVFFLTGINSLYLTSIIYKIGRSAGNFIALILFFITEFILIAIYTLVAFVLYTNVSVFIIGIALVILNIIINLLLIFILGKFVKTTENLR